MAEKKRIPIIVVGTGHHFQRNLAPALTKLIELGLIEVITTVDILVRGEQRDLGHVAHVKRNNRPLHEQLKEYKKLDPIVILGHTNGLHAKDAHDLLSHGFRVIVEKPYAITAQSLAKLVGAIDSERTGFLEYYLAMKSVPLLLGYGEVSPKSFYLTEKLMNPTRHFAKYAKSVAAFRRMLPNIIGTVTKVEVEVLEGEGETGTLERRGIDTIDVRFGGGSIQDMAIHAIAPVLALERTIGSLPEDVSYSARSARCVEYVRMARKRFAIPLEHIGETYAEFSYVTTKGIPVTARVGKYVFEDYNRRGLRITGTKGEVYMDWNSCTLYVNGTPILEMEKSYYPVVRAAIEGLSKMPLFGFDALDVAARAQQAVFDVQKAAYAFSRDAYYNRHTNPADIFSEATADCGAEIHDEVLRPEDDHNEWLKIIGKELPEFFPKRAREHVRCPGCGSEEVESEFLKLGFIYKWCKDCFSLYASPRPSEREVDAFYRDSEAMRFYAENIFKATLDARREHQIAPLAQWVKKTMPARMPKGVSVLDFMPKFYSVWPEVLSPKHQANVLLVDPVHLHKAPEPATVGSLTAAKRRTYDFITAFDVLEHRADPDTTIKMLSKLCNSGGTLFLTLNAGGFEYQVLGQDSHRLVPPSRLNLLTVEALEHLLTKHGFEPIDVTSTGKLDVDIVLKALAEDRSTSVARFFSYLLKKRGAEVSESLQQFLQEHKLSSFVRVAARKK